MSNDVKENLLSVDQWLRILFIAIFAFVCWVLIFVVGVLVIAQALIALFTGSDNTNLRMLGNGLSQYVKQILQYMTYNSDIRPFPFSPFPDISEPEHDSPADTDYKAEYETQYEASSYGYEEVSQPEDRSEDEASGVVDTAEAADTSSSMSEKTGESASSVTDTEPDFSLDDDENRQADATNQSRDIDPEPVRTAAVDIEDDDDVFADISFTRSSEPAAEDDDEIPDLILDDDEADKDKDKS